MRLKDKVSVITGGNSGIGLATAKLFQSEGAKVAIIGRREDAVNDAVSELGGESQGYYADVSNFNEFDDIYSRISNSFGKIDSLFLNAGIAPFLPLEHATPEHFDEIMNINVKGLYFGVQKALPYLNDKASIIFTGSIVNQSGMAGASVYSASKAAVRSFARTMSAELVGRGIRVNVVSPGPIETPIFSKMGMSQEQASAMAEGITQMVPMKRFGRADEVANAALFLASDESSFVLGAEINVDGGMAHL